MNFTGTVLRPMLALVTGAVLFVGVLSLLVTPQSSRPVVSPAADVQALKAHRVALRQLGKKLTTVEIPAEKVRPQLLAQSP